METYSKTSVDAYPIPRISELINLVEQIRSLTQKDVGKFLWQKRIHVKQPLLHLLAFMNF